MQPPTSDAELMGRVASGDERALRIVGALHMGRVIRLAQRMLGSASEADDVAQETLVKLWMNAARWDEARGSLATWITTIAYRLCLDRLRAGKTRMATMPLEDAQDVAESGRSAVDTLIRRDELARLQASMNRLPARQRAAFLLFYVDEHSGPDCARIMGVGLRAYWSLLHRARQAVERGVVSPHTRGTAS